MARAFLEDIPASRFTEETILRMFELVDQAKTDADWQKLVYGRVNAALPGKWKDYRAELQAFFDWTKDRIDYRRDPVGVELVQDVHATLDRGRADCDDFVVFLCGGAEVLGAPCRFVTISTRPDREMSHVFAQAWVGGEWLGMDAIVPESYVGWEPQMGVTARKVWDRKTVGLEGYDDLDGFVEGLGVMGNGPPGPREGGFASNWWAPDLAPGVSRHASRTWGEPHAGEAMITDRFEHGEDVLRVADRTNNLAPGGGEYNLPHLDVASHPMPHESFGLVGRDRLCPVGSPREAWWGTIPGHMERDDAMYPEPAAPEAEYVRDMQGLGGMGDISRYMDVIGKVAGSVVDAVKTGELPSTKEAVDAAIDIGLSTWQKREAEKRAKAEAERAAAEARAEAEREAALRVTPPAERRSPWLVPGLIVGGLLVAGGGLGGGRRRRRRR